MSINRLFSIFYLILISSFFSCSNGNKQVTSKNTQYLDSTHLEHWLTPNSNQTIAADLKTKYIEKSDIKASEISIKNDTLSIVSTGWYFYYPFGKVHHVDSLKGIFPKFKLLTVLDTDKTDLSDTITVYRFSYKRNFLKFLQEPDTHKFEIVSGNIVDSTIDLLNGTKVGMSKSAFLDLYFKTNVNKETEKINVVEFITGLEGMWHYYTFRNNRLVSIRFDTDYQVNKN